MAGEVEKLQELVEKYDNIVFFGGAGVSTESGIPDFRSQDGLYHQKYDYPPETILSHTFFMRKPEEFFKFMQIGTHINWMRQRIDKWLLINLSVLLAR